jgi:hypothetical protein
MPKSVLDEPRFRNEEAAYAYVESIIWKNGRLPALWGYRQERRSQRQEHSDWGLQVLRLP